jgi:hypothetical protein
MAEEPDIIYSDTPSVVNLSFGKNVFSFYDQNETGLKAGIQVYDNTDTELIGTFQSPPNTLGYYYFDLQNLLKNYTTPCYSAETYTNDLFTADNESFESKVRYGWVNDSGVFQYAGTYPGTGQTDNCLVLGGRKNYDDLTWSDKRDYISSISGILSCPVISRRQQALTDYTIQKNVSDLTGGVPDWIRTSSVYNIEKRFDDEYILSFLTNYDDNVSFPSPTGCDGLKAIRITFYNGDTQTYDEFIQNIEANGGGPTGSITLDRNWIYPYNAISFPSGRRNFITEYDAGLTHCYVAAYTYKGTSCGSSQGTYYSNNHTSEVYRVDIVDDKCNDFAPVQVSWLNSLGFRDYFYFSKRTDENINITRNNYEKVEGSWSSSSFIVNPYDRGQTTFSQDLTINRTINTRFLSDAEAAWLKNLFISPDVRVRYDGTSEFIPITITDNRWTERTFRKDKLFQNTLTYVEAHKINSQRG